VITVKLLGGARKSFPSDTLQISRDLMTIHDLLEYIDKNALESMPHLDPNNILVAVNGVDSSALHGKFTVLKGGDIVSIIPLIHGGKSKRIQFDLMKNVVELIRLKKTKEDPIRFIKSLREQHPNLVIQGIQASFVLNTEHVKKIIIISLYAQRTGVLLSNKIETDILMRFACTRQINDAISKVGVKKKTDSILIVIGKKSQMEKLYNEIEYLVQNSVFLKDNSRFIKKEFGITKKQLDCVFSKTPLEDLLAEKSATLFH
jgi:tRNA threonylcarbamoyladenosine modification (KEOPS) complex Cgi121 subunit/molybdopterin converting factor small subunit